MAIFQTCTICKKVIRSAVHMCVVGGLVAGPIAAGDYELAQDALGALADFVSNARSTVTSLTAEVAPTLHVAASSGGSELLPFPVGQQENVMPRPRPRNSQIYEVTTTPLALLTSTT